MPDALKSIVDAAVASENPHTEPNDSHTQAGSGDAAKHSSSDTPRLTPSMRTGPPRSISYGMSMPSSPVTGPRAYNSKDVTEDGALPFSLSRNGFRTPLELQPEGDKKGKRRDTRILDDSWNPLKWFQDSPVEDDKPGFFTSPEANAAVAQPAPQSATVEEEDEDSPHRGLERASSMPDSPGDKRKTAPKWGRLRSLLPHIASQASKTPTPGASVVSHTVNITDELIAGGLSTLMLGLWFERDEKEHRRIPALFHRLRIRVTDSLNPLDGQKSTFRIECEMYENGSIRWVVYRQLRDFLSLHAHYALSNAYNRNVDDLPEFPMTS